MKLYNTLKSIILEAAEKQKVRKAINDRQRVQIDYRIPEGEAPDGVTEGPRVIEPVCLGISKGGNKVIRAWQLSPEEDGGVSNRGIPGWKLFRLDRITYFTPTGTNFDEPRPNFNPDGDKTMSEVIQIVKF